MMNAVESPPVPLRGAQLWPLSVAAYRALGENGPDSQKHRTPLRVRLYENVQITLSQFPGRRLLAAARFRHAANPYRALGTTHHLRGFRAGAGHCRRSRSEKTISGINHPRTAELVIEVCVTSHDYDRSKLRAYAAAGVKECWLILGPEKQIEVYRQPKDGQFTEHALHGPGGTLTSAALPEFTLALDAFFAK